MIAQEFEASLHMAFIQSRQKRHEFITVEHLLLALLDNPSAAEVLVACAIDIEELRTLLHDHINQHTPIVGGSEDVDTQPTLGFQRVIQRAILHVQSSGKKEVTGASVLAAIFGDKDSHAVYFLQQKGITRLDVTNYISHKICKVSQNNEQNNKTEEESENEQQSAASSPLESYTINLNNLAMANRIDPLIGREKELERVIQTLMPASLARYAWIIDLQNRRFLACTVQAGEMKNVTEDDVTLYSQSFTIRSGWEDTNYNLPNAL